MYRDRRPKLDWFLKNWSLRDTSQISDKFNFVNEEIEKDRMQRYRDTARFFKKVINSRNILDIGSGTGTGLKSFEDEGFTVTGIEPDTSRARVGRDRYGVNIIETTVDSHNLEFETFDIVTCIHSLEHFHAPGKIMKSIANLVKEGGHVYIEVPDFMNFVTDWNDAIFLAHLNNFSENNLNLLGLSVGLRPIIRTYPKPSGIAHLGILFCKDSLNKYNKEEYLNTKAVHNQYQHAIDMYSNGLADKFLRDVNKFTYNVPVINDISLSYKATSKTKTLVESNYLQRNISYDENSGEFIVSEPSEVELLSNKIKEKELNFVNRLSADNKVVHKNPEISYIEY